MENVNNFLNNLIQHLNPEKGSTTFVLEKNQMLKDKGKNPEGNHMVLKTKKINFFITDIIENKFQIIFQSIYIDNYSCNFTWNENENEKEIKLVWDRQQVKIFENNTLIEEKKFPVKLPGGTIEVVLNAKKNEDSKEQYVLDIGDENNLLNERISLFLEKDYSLVFRIIDLDGKAFSVKQKIADIWNLDKWHKIKISWGEKIVKMRVCKSIDENSEFNEVKNNKLENIKLFYFPVSPKLVIGTDLKKEKFCKMSLKELKIYNIPKF